MTRSKHNILSFFLYAGMDDQQQERLKQLHLVAKTVNNSMVGSTLILLSNTLGCKQNTKSEYELFNDVLTTGDFWKQFSWGFFPLCFKNNNALSQSKERQWEQLL